MTSTILAWAIKAPHLDNWIYIHTIRFEKEDAIEAARLFHIDNKNNVPIRVLVKEIESTAAGRRKR
jgi:hypothetical protein